MTSASRPAGPSRGAPARLLALVPGWVDLAYALHASLGGLAALWLAMWLELDAPYWAGSTVLITAQASRPKGLLKGVNRIVGTAVGTAVGVGLIALAPQSWAGYLGLHTLWLATCTYVSCLLKDMQSYAAALSGYTALIVAIGSFGDPVGSFDVAVSRGSSVVLGVTTFMLTLHLLTPSNDAPALRAKLGGWTDDGLALAVRLLRGQAGRDEVASFLPRLADLDAAVEEAATEAPWVSPRRPVLRGAVLALADCVMDAALVREARGAEAAPLAARIEALRPRALPYTPHSYGRLRPRRGADRPLQEPAAELVHRAQTALDGGQALHRDRLPALCDPVRRALDRDARGAGYAALRAALGMGSACAIWVGTRWPSGGDFVEVTGILCCLMASRPSPIGNAEKFTLGTVMSAVAALGIGFFVLPLVSGFGWLAAALFPLLLTGALGVRSKALAGYFTPLNFFLMSMIGVRNMMSYDPLTFFNSAQGLLAGALYAVLMFQLLPPPDEGRQAASLQRRLRTGLAAGTDDEEARLVSLQRVAALLPMLPAEARPDALDEAMGAWRRRLDPP